MTPENKHIAGLELAQSVWNKADSVLRYGILLRDLIAQAKAAPEPVQGEAVGVVGYGCAGQIEVLKHVPLTGGMKVSGQEGGRYTVPLMAVAQHKRMMLALAIRCDQKGAFKTCMECGYQDGHDEICQYHESKRAIIQPVTREDAERFLVAYHAEVWAAAEDDDSRVAYDDAGRSLAKAFLAKFDGTAAAKPDAEMRAQVEAMRAALDAVMTMDVRGHQLQDRLQFSTKGREILDKVKAALQATK